MDPELQEGMVEPENPFRIFLSQVQSTNEELSQRQKNHLIELYATEHDHCEGQSFELYASEHDHWESYFCRLSTTRAE